MHDIFKNMEEIFRLEHVTRLFTCEPHVNVVGYDSHKTGWKEISSPARMIGYLFILSGEGLVKIGGEAFAVKAPAMIVRRHSSDIAYGPDGAWEEFWITFLARWDTVLKRRNLLPDAPVTCLRSSYILRHRVSEIVERLRSVERCGVADKIDRLCELLIVECLLDRDGDFADPHEKAVREIRAYVEENFLTQHNFEKLAHRAHMTSSTFRRYWKRIVGPPPMRYQMMLKLDYAGRKLLETNIRVKPLAQELGFDNPLYFSRVFRQYTGFSPRAYRKNRPPETPWRGR